MGKRIELWLFNGLAVLLGSPVIFVATWLGFFSECFRVAFADGGMMATRAIARATAEKDAA
ncbi:MAG: hypothetical protein HQL79_07620 [Magnetococcales bacterium]|nr:hypothetical protein [Magnetococcales bacterium]